LLQIKISFDFQSGQIESHLDDEQKEYHKRNKGQSLISFPNDYIVIDTETTGLDPEYDELIEVTAIKIRDGKEVESFDSLIKPTKAIPSFITELTGITNEMLKDAPSPKNIIPDLRKFISNDILIAHNAHFDINFLYDYIEEYLEETFTNNFICTMRLSRRIFPEFENHKLKTICKNLSIAHPLHRSLADATAAWEVYKCCKSTVEKTMSIEEFLKKSSHTLKAKDITVTTDNFNRYHPLFGKTCVFTGTLSKMVRQDAMQLVINLGGMCTDNVNKKTDYLVIGIQDYSRFTDGKKSRKLRKAEELIKIEHEVEIISENNFYDLVLEDS
jgi:DNA polymerase-3 subunit epsilon